VNQQQGATETLTEIFAAAEAFNAAAAATAQDRTLSADGRALGSRRVAEAALAKLTAVERSTIQNLTDRAASLEKVLRGTVTLRAPRDPADRIAHELQLQEIRSQLRELPLSERHERLSHVERSATLAAIETAPMTLSAKRPNGSGRLEPFVDPAEKTAAQLARAEQADPTRRRRRHCARSRICAKCFRWRSIASAKRFWSAGGGTGAGGHDPCAAGADVIHASVGVTEVTATTE
jgi:hypothetical protein